VFTNFKDENVGGAYICLFIFFTVGTFSFFFFSPRSSFVDAVSSALNVSVRAGLDLCIVSVSSAQARTLTDISNNVQ
jgi:hypothetical protein